MAKVPEDLKQKFAEVAARRAAIDEQAINALLPLLHLCVQYQGDETKVKAIQKRLGIELSQVCLISSAQDATDEQRAKLLAYALSANVFELADILAEIETA
jgi:hypothetical protein